MRRCIASVEVFGPDGNLLEFWSPKVESRAPMPAQDTAASPAPARPRGPPDAGGGGVDGVVTKVRDTCGVPVGVTTSAEIEPDPGRRLTLVHAARALGRAPTSSPSPPTLPRWFESSFDISLAKPTPRRSTWQASYLAYTPATRVADL